MANDTDTDTIYHVLANLEGLYRQFQSIVGQAWWDDDDNTWNDINKSAKQLSEFVSGIDTTPDELGDLRGINLDRIDWNELIVGELRQANKDAGRAENAGFDH